MCKNCVHFTWNFILSIWCKWNSSFKIFHGRYLLHWLKVSHNLSYYNKQNNIILSPYGIRTGTFLKIKISYFLLYYDFCSKCLCESYNCLSLILYYFWVYLFKCLAGVIIFNTFPSLPKVSFYIYFSQLILNFK